MFILCCFFFLLFYFIYNVFINIHKYASQNFVSQSESPTEQFGMNLKALGVQDISYLNPPPMRGSRNFRRGWGGGPGQSDKKSSDNFFFFVLSLFYRSQMVNFKEIYHFSRFQRGSNICQGNQLFPGGGSNCSLIETHITCDFPGGSGPPVPPSGSALASPRLNFLRDFPSFF